MFKHLKILSELNFLTLNWKKGQIKNIGNGTPRKEAGQTTESHTADIICIRVKFDFI